jgi:hypothetical protein
LGKQSGISAVQLFNCSGTRLTQKYRAFSPSSDNGEWQATP